MTRTGFAGFLFCLFYTLVAATAQAPALPPDLAAAPDELKTLNWKTVDLASLTPIEHCRALLLMNHALDEISTTATTEADLMSEYIETNNLGADFAKTPPPPNAVSLSYVDIEKIAVALLRGPMSKSFYATELSDIPEAGLSSYSQMYERTCHRRWSEVDESRHLVRCMTSYLGNSGKLEDYKGWATAQMAQKQAQFEKKALAGGAAPAVQAPAVQAPTGQPAANAQVAALSQQNQQLQQALSVAEYQQQMAQQQASQPQQQAAQSQQQVAQPGQPGYVAPYCGYGVPAYYGGAYAAAAYTQSAAYKSSAQSSTNQRMSNFHGTSAAVGYHAANQPHPNAGGRR